MTRIRAVAVSLYLMVIYWASSHYPDAHTLFFPTLGAFCLLFMTRSFERKTWTRISAGAVVGATVGTLLYSINPGPITFFINALVMITLITRMKWNAPPIMAVSFIPYFSHPTTMWVLPVSVAMSLSGLIATLWFTETLEQGLVAKRSKQVESGM
ncbi:HPP family protein [Paenibacillus kobensis]|uniref:HPP family protein n=1 Tax=Paenibacillus kobensis TaxID=59841 RepID=UPI000FDAEC0D|nr:HPP family protein [Paenibacillus kobensis]